jgi:hypothetical protein
VTKQEFKRLWRRMAIRRAKRRCGLECSPARLATECMLAETGYVIERVIVDEYGDFETPVFLGPIKAEEYRVVRRKGRGWFVRYSRRYARQGLRSIRRALKRYRRNAISR